MGISSKQFETLSQRVAGGKKARPAPVDVSAIPPRRSRTAVILGVDPSLRGTGYGVIHVAKSEMRSLDHGTIRSPSSWEHSRCLVNIASSLRQVIAAHQPTVCICEGLFFAQNIKTALIMGEARGAALAAVAEAGLEVFEMAPRKMKQAIVGYGAAQKSAVAKMVQRMLAMKEEPEPDAADALGLALAFAQENGRGFLSSTRKV